MSPFFAVNMASSDADVKPLNIQENTSNDVSYKADMKADAVQFLQGIEECTSCVHGTCDPSFHYRV